MGGVQQEHLSSYLCVYDTENGTLLYEKEIPLCWITHVQFHPLDSELIMYNHEWASFVAESGEFGSMTTAWISFIRSERKERIRLEIQRI